MCGRYVENCDFIQNFHEYLQDFLDAMEPGSRFNIAPHTSAFVRRWENNASCVAAAKWGLVPAWYKDTKSRLINARSETADSLPSFRAAFKQRRCLVLATGYFEWLSTSEGKQPYLIHRADNKPFLMQGLWERWRGPKGEPPRDEPLHTYTILTTNARDDLKDIHDRMPCMVDIDADSLEGWLDPKTGTAEARQLLLPYSGDLQLTKVSKYVNSVRNQGPECVLPI